MKIDVKAIVKDLENKPVPSDLGDNSPDLTVGRAIARSLIAQDSKSNDASKADDVTLAYRFMAAESSESGMIELSDKEEERVRARIVTQHPLIVYWVLRALETKAPEGE